MNRTVLVGQPRQGDDRIARHGGAAPARKVDLEMGWESRSSGYPGVGGGPPLPGSVRRAERSRDAGQGLVAMAALFPGGSLHFFLDTPTGVQLSWDEFGKPARYGACGVEPPVSVFHSARGVMVKRG